MSTEKKTAKDEPTIPPEDIPTGSINEPNAPRTMPEHMSINEPAPPAAPAPEPPPPLVLSDIDPDVLPVQPPAITSTALTVTGEGFTAECLVLFDDEEVPTTLISSTTLMADVPLSQTPGVHDVEVQRGDELSDVLVFEIAAAARENKSAPARKPKKETPASKRAKRHKSGSY